MGAADVEGHGCNANVDVEEASQLAETQYETQVLRTLGGTPNGDPCSFWGSNMGVLRDIGVI